MPRVLMGKLEDKSYSYLCSILFYIRFSRHIFVECKKPKNLKFLNTHLIFAPRVYLLKGSPISFISGPFPEVTTHKERHIIIWVKSLKLVVTLTSTEGSQQRWRQCAYGSRRAKFGPGFVIWQWPWPLYKNLSYSKYDYT